MTRGARPAKAATPPRPSPSGQAHRRAAKPQKLSQDIRPAVQERSARSAARLLTAAETLFAEKGFRGTTIAEIIKASGVSTGSFYHRFNDKEGIARVMIDDFMASSIRRIAEMKPTPATHPDMRSVLKLLSETVYDALRQHIGTYRAAMRLGQTEPEVLALTATLVLRLRDQVLAHLGPYRAEIGADDPDLAVSNAVQLVTMVISQKLLGQGALFPADKDGLTTILVASGGGILKLKEPER